jgi:hypothetical protein
MSGKHATIFGAGEIDNKPVSFQVDVNEGRAQILFLGWVNARAYHQRSLHA